MAINLTQLTSNVLTSSDDQRYDCLCLLLAAVKCAQPAELVCLEKALPDLASFLYAPDGDNAGNITLEIFHHCRINQSVIIRLIELQGAHSNPLIIRVFGLSKPETWNADVFKILANALAMEDTASAAAEVLFRHSLAINISLTIDSLENLALNVNTQSRSDAISKLISHTEGSHAALACQSLRNILNTVDQTLRVEIAAKLAWSHKHGLSLLKITAADCDPDVRLASAKSLWHSYQYRGRQLLTALSEDDDLKVRTVAIQALS